MTTAKFMIVQRMYQGQKRGLGSVIRSVIRSVMPLRITS